MKGDTQNGFRLKGWQVYPLRNLLVGPEGEIHIEPKVMQVLESLADNPGEVVERETLLQDIWDGRAFTDEPLTRCIAELRHALGDDPHDPKYIQTIPKRGYRLVCPVKSLDDSRDPGGRRIALPVFVGLVLIAAAYLAYLSMLSSPVESPQLSVEGTTQTAPSRYSIAVLPFVNMSSDPEQEYFSDGLAEEILIVLARVPDLAVAPRTSTFAYKGDNRKISQIAKELRVNYMLVGSVRKAGNRVRIIAELIDVGNDVQLWSDSFERELNDVFEIQDEIAKAIGQTLEIRLADTHGNAISVSGTNNAGALNAYLKGRYLLHKRGNVNVGRAIEYFQMATELDPEFAEAHASRAIAKALGWGQSDPGGATLSATRALELDRSLPMAWTAAGLAAHKQFKFAEAEQAYREALVLEPNNAEVAHFLAFVLYDMGQLEQAMQLGVRAVSLDPRTPIYRAFLGEYHMALGQVTQGMTHLEAALEMGTEVYPFVVLWKAVTGDTEGAFAILAQRAANYEMEVDEEAIARAFILVAAGRVEEARLVISGRNNVLDSGIKPAIVFAYLGDIDEANRVIETAFANGFAMSSIRFLIRFMPDFPIRKTRYNELRASVGLPGLDNE